MNCNISKRDFKTVISNINYLANDVMEITFKIIDNDRMCFTPGQFIIVKIDKEKSIMRAYSVLDYNLDSNEIKIAVKKVENGVGTSIIFDTFKQGLEVNIMGSMGNKLIVDKSEKDLVLVATGIGITPILCILNDLVDTKYDGNITFMYGARTKSELFYLSDIDKIESKNANVKFIPVLSREQIEGYNTGYITDVIKEMNLDNKHIYMCSSRPVASSFKETLELKGFDLSKFSCESA